MVGFNKNAFLKDIANDRGGDSTLQPGAEEALKKIRQGLLAHLLNSIIALIFGFFLLLEISQGIQLLPLLLVMLLFSYPAATVLVYLHKSVIAAGYLAAINVLAIIAMLANMGSAGGSVGSGLPLTAMLTYASIRCLMGVVDFQRIQQTLGTRN